MAALATTIPTVQLAPSPSLSASPSASSSSSSLIAGSLPYECSLQSSDVDLSLRDDLATSVQDYLMRIVDELQQLSKWTRGCDVRLSHSETLHAQHAESAQQQQSRQHVPMLFVQTEMELVRRDIQLASQDVFQRATTQLAYVQNSFRSEYDDQLAEMQRRFEDKLRFFTHKTVALLETSQTETQSKLATMETSLQKLQQQLQSEQTRLEKLETTIHEALPSLTATQVKQLSELNTTQRRLENLESATSLQLTEFRNSMGESLQAMRASQTQLAAKLQVVRMETQEQSEDLNRKVLQLHRFLSRIPQMSAGAGSMLLTGLSGEQMAVAPSSAVTLPKAAAGTGVRVAIGATAISRASGDCFLHARAALPPRGDARDLSKRPSSSSGHTSGLPPSPQPTASLGGSITVGGGNATKKDTQPLAGGTMDQALSIQSSTLSQPVGREEETVSGAVRAASLAAAGSVEAVASPRKSSLRSQMQPVVIPTGPVLRPRAPSPSPRGESFKQR